MSLQQHDDGWFMVLGTSAQRRRSNRRREGQRGATLVEYALGVALVAVASISGISAVEDASEDQLNDRASSIGAPDLGATNDPAPPPPPPPPPDDPDPDPQPESEVSISVASTASRDGQQWAATVTVTALDDTNRPREAVAVAGSWTALPTPLSGEPISTQCSTSLSGVCTITLRNLDRSTQTQATLTITSVSGPNITFVGTLPIIQAVNAP